MIEGLKPYPEYKESGHRWLGSVPNHWSVLPNRALFDEVKDRNHPKEEMLSVTITRGIVRQKALLDGSSKKDSSNLNKGAYKLVQPHDIAYNKMRAWQGALGASTLRGIISPAYVVMRPRKEANPWFYHNLYRTPSFAKEAERWSYGITSDMWSLRPEHFKVIGSVLPPLDEQSAIVRFLEHANRKIDAFIRTKRKLIGLLNEQKQAIIHRAVTRGIHPDVPLKPSGIPWLGDIPMHWEVKKLRFLFRYAKGSRAAELTNEYIGQNAGEFPVFSGQTEHGGLMGRISWHEFDFASPVIFVSTVGARAMTTRILSGKFSLSQNCALIIPRNSQANPIYFEKVFQRLFAFERYSISQVMQPSLRFADLNRFYVPHPPINEQEAIASEIERECSKLNTAIARTEREIALMQEYRTRLTADLVTGKLDVREAAAKLPAAIDEGNAKESSSEISEESEEEILES
jgi:type I restriction enzyme S subunit